MSEETGSASVESSGAVESAGSDESLVGAVGADFGEEAVAEAIKTWRVKIDGEEQDVSEEELLKGYQSTKSAQQKFNEAAHMRKQAEEFIKLAKSDPRKLLTHPGIGVDLQAFANAILSEQLEEQLLSPEEKELRDTKRKLAEYEEAKRIQEEARQQEELDKYTQMYEQEYTEKIIGALETSGLPKTEYTVKKIAEKMLIAAERGLDVEPADVIQFVKADYMNDIKMLFGSANEDILLSMLGDDVTKKVVKGHLKKVQPKIKSPVKMTTPTKAVIPGQKQESTRNKSREEWLKEIAERAKS